MLQLTYANALRIAIDRAMSDWREEFCVSLGHADSIEKVLAELHRRTRALDFSHCSFGIRLSLPVAKRRFHLVSDYPPEWQQRYVNRGYFAVDPTVRHGLTERLPLVWSADQFKHDSAFWDDARSFGLNHGWSLPVHGGHGSVGMFSLVRERPALGDAERDHSELKMFWLAQLAHTVLSGLLLAQMLPEATVAPTPREREVLLWAAAGKSNFEIGAILGVDGRTVKFHFGNLMRKFNAANRTEATIKAVLMGAIE
jgi:DNA-binding CsgD family transcriptional regulator